MELGTAGEEGGEVFAGGARHQAQDFAARQVAAGDKVQFAAVGGVRAGVEKPREDVRAMARRERRPEAFGGGDRLRGVGEQGVPIAQPASGLLAPRAIEARRPDERGQGADAGFIEPAGEMRAR